MSPARSRRTPLPRRRSRAEILHAAGVGAAIVLVTAAAVWLMRPGPAGTEGTGGLMNRQPRASAVVLGAILLAALASWWILRVSRRSRGHEKVVLPIALGVVLALAVGAGVAWPDGLLRHGVAPPKPITPTTSSTRPSSTTSTTGASGATTAPSTTGATSTTGSPSSSTTPTTGTTTSGP